MSDLETRQIGRHLFLFPKTDQIGGDGSPTIVAKPVAKTQDLPREFVRYLRALFDILDQNGRGLVRLSDIEARWSTTSTSNGLTGAVIQSLQQVTPKNGLLSFERLCSGFRLALKSQPTINGYGASNTKRSRSMPQLDVLHKDWTSDSSEDSFQNYDSKRNGEIMDKIRTWRSTNVERLRHDEAGNSSTGSNSPSSERSSPPRTCSTKVYFIGNEAATPKTNDITVRAAPKVTNGAAVPNYPTKNGLVAQPVLSKNNGIVAHASGTNGVTNFDKEKRLQELTEENDVLQNGLEIVEKARKWYFKRITAVQEEKLHLKESEQYTTEQLQYEVLLHKTRRKELGLNGDLFRQQKSHVQEMTKCLTRLTTGQAPAKDAAPALSSDQKVFDEMQALRKELAEKNIRISQLEREKSELIRDLFNGKAANAVRRVPSVVKNSKVL